ncbi:hypothetical protein P3T23_007531 [Paraburkholderia sp. GAS448]|uniref:hypothetical protein n=1 Tax=Paraburkholderia sp. GAS448 TaxID=3035136 RepID=UPI003D1CAF22
MGSFVSIEDEEFARKLRWQSTGRRLSRRFAGRIDAALTGMVARVFANSELLSAKRFEFDPAGVTEFAKNVDRAVRQHVAQLRKRLVGSKIGIDDRSAYPVGFFCDPERRLDAHAAYLRVNADKGVKIGLVVLQRIHIAFRGIFDEVSVQFLAAQSILCDPLRPDLSVA